MSVDIQKQLDLHPYSDKKITAKPVAEAQPQVTQSADEEKSNAAKWMIGLTATAAIVLGGLYAAKHGHLGKDAEKFAKRILGEGTTGAKASAATTTTGNTNTNSPAITSNKEESINPLPVVIPALVVARKGVSRIIKHPEKSMAEVIAGLEESGIKFKKSGDDFIQIKTGKGEFDFTDIKFNPDGTLASIERATRNACKEIFNFENGILRGIKRSYENTVPEITQKIEFNDAQKVSKEFFEFKRNVVLSGVLKRVRGMKDTYTTGQSCWWYDILKNNYEKLPTQLRKAKIFYNEFADFETAPYMTARICKYYNAALKDIPAKVPSEELVRSYRGKLGDLFDNTVQDLDIARRISQRTANIPDKPILEKTPRDIVEQFASNRIARSDILQNIRALMPEKNSDDTVKTIAKLLEKDMGNAKDIDENIILHAIRNYNSILNTYKINTPEKLQIITKPLNECTKADFIEILGSRDAVHKKLPGCFDDYGMLDVEYLSSLPGFSYVKNNMTPFDILQDLAK